MRCCLFHGLLALRWAVVSSMRRCLYDVEVEHSGVTRDESSAIDDESGANQKLEHPGPRSTSNGLPADSNDWLGCSPTELPIADASQWVQLPNCGAVVVFSGTARDHSEGRVGVSELVYEAYEEQVVPSLQRVVDELRSRWPAVGRVALLHRVGSLNVGDTAVVVAVSAPHRVEAFEAARFGIDALKASAPIWKRERWADGDDWGTGAIDSVRDFGPIGATIEPS